MPYALPGDVTDVLTRDAVDSTTSAGTAASLPNATLSAAITSAQNEIDARLAQRYTVPFADTAVPPVVASLTVDLAAYRATLTYRMGKDLSAEDPVVLRHTLAMTLLKDLASGAADLPGVDTGAVSEKAGVSVRNRYYGKFVTMDDFGLGPSLDPRRLGSWGGW